MKEIVIYEFQLDRIIEALRITSNIHNCKTKETCFDRQVCQALAFARNAKEGNKDKQVNYL
jgi:hypothetical protein